MNRRFWNILILLLCPLLLHAYTVSKLPMEMTFDAQAEQADWKFVNSANAQANTWLIHANPEFSYRGTNMLYMSNDNGNTCAYTTVANDTLECWAYCPISGLPAGQYVIDFHYRGPRDTTGTLCMAVLTTEPAMTGNYEWSADFPADFWWQDAKYAFTANANTTYYLCFRARCFSDKVMTDTGWAIDAIQIYPKDKAFACAHVPVDLTCTHHDNRYVYSWEGNASEYQVEYYVSDSSSPQERVIDNVTGNSYSIGASGMAEGTYNFRVRAICELDTSAWTAWDYQLIYDKTRRCMDYLEVGDKATIHYYPHDFDRRTNYKLRTFPAGFPASARLGNWQTGSQNVIEYTFTPSQGVLQVRYALVMQMQNHTTATQPSFTLELLDETGQLVDSCDFVDFTKEWAKDTLWQKEKVDGIADSVLWRDWFQVGVNTHHYVGKPMKVRITAKDCSDGNHFGYAYFTLACSPGIIEGTHCGRQPESLWVDDGFYYRWYQKYDPNHEIKGRDRIYYPNYHPFDSATYCVDLMNKMDTNCFFTLEASVLAFETVPVGSAKYDPSDCKNYVQFYNESYTIGKYFDENQNQWIVKDTEYGVDRMYWDFGRGRQDNRWAPRVEFPQAGERLHVTLHTFEDDCENTIDFYLDLPRIGAIRKYFPHQFCEGDVFVDSLYDYPDHQPHLYIEEGDYIINSYKNWQGCDSFHILSLRYYFRMEKQEEKDTLCMSVGSTEWRGMTLTKGGLYHDTLRSEIYGCDSIIYTLNLSEQPILNVDVNYEPQSFCATGGTVTVPFTIHSGSSITYDLLFNDTAKMLGLKDRLNQPLALTDTKVEIPLDTAWPGPYKANLVFRNYKCDTAQFPIAFTIFYTPDSVITQRWNNFLSVRKTAYDYYGGFYDYQWYKDGKKLDGETGSQLFLQDGKLDLNAAYMVELTRVKDGIRVRSCEDGFRPKANEPDSVTLKVTPTVISSHRRVPVHVQTNETGQAFVYYQSGELIGRWAIKENDNQLLLPACTGIYLVRVLFDSGRTETRKIIVE